MKRRTKNPPLRIIRNIADTGCKIQSTQKKMQNIPQQFHEWKSSLETEISTNKATVKTAALIAHFCSHEGNMREMHNLNIPHLLQNAYRTTNDEKIKSICLFGISEVIIDNQNKLEMFPSYLKFFVEELDKQIPPVLKSLCLKGISEFSCINGFVSELKHLGWDITTFLKYLNDDVFTLVLTNVEESFKITETTLQNTLAYYAIRILAQLGQVGSNVKMLADAGALEKMNKMVQSKHGPTSNMARLCIQVWAQQYAQIRDKQECDECHKQDVKLLQCSRCKKVRYCSKDCQMANWKKHKKDCTAD
jgi:hypothetical protein